MKSVTAAAILCCLAGVVVSAPTLHSNINERGFLMTTEMAGQEKDMRLEERDMLHAQHKELVADIAKMYASNGEDMMDDDDDMDVFSDMSDYNATEAEDFEEHMEEQPTDMTRRADEQTTEAEANGPQPRRGYPVTGLIPIRTKSGIIKPIGFAPRDTS